MKAQKRADQGVSAVNPRTWVWWPRKLAWPFALPVCCGCLWSHIGPVCWGKKSYLVNSKMCSGSNRIKAVSDTSDDNVSSFPGKTRSTNWGRLRTVKINQKIYSAPKTPVLVRDGWGNELLKDKTWEEIKTVFLSKNRAQMWINAAYVRPRWLLFCRWNLVWAMDNSAEISSHNSAESDWEKNEVLSMPAWYEMCY